MENEENKGLEITNSSEASPVEQKPDTSKLDETSLKTTEGLEKELAKAKETLQKAEHTIVQLKKNVSIDVQAIKNDILGEVKKELEPTLSKLSQVEKLKRENEELRASLNSKEGQSPVGDGHTVVKEDNKQTPTDEDIKLANKFFKGDVAKYMKYRVNK